MQKQRERETETESCKDKQTETIRDLLPKQTCDALMYSDTHKCSEGFPLVLDDFQAGSYRLIEVM